MNAETLKLMKKVDRVFTQDPFLIGRQIAAYLPRNKFHSGGHGLRRLKGVMAMQAIYKHPQPGNTCAHV